MKRTKQLLTLALAIVLILSSMGFVIQAFAMVAETPSRIVTSDWELADAILEANPGDTIGIDGYFTFSSGYIRSFGDSEKQVYIKRMDADTKMVFYGQTNFENLIFDGNGISSSNFIILSCNATFQNCTFQNICGGTVTCSVGEQTFTNCTFDDCNDGCINIEWGAYKTSFRNCTFTNNNRTSGVGGAIRNEGDLTLDSCLITDNSCMVDGGAVFNYHLLTITNSKIYGNKANGNASDIATRVNEAEGLGITFTDDSEALNALFTEDGFTAEWNSEAVNDADYGSYTRYVLSLTEIPGEEEPTEEEPSEEPTEEPSEESSEEPSEDAPSEDKPAEEQSEESSTPSDADDEKKEEATPSETKEENTNSETKEEKTDSESSTPSSNSSNTSSGGGTSSSSSNPSNDSSSSLRIDEPLGTVENNITIESPYSGETPLQVPSEIHISGNMGNSGDTQGNIPLQQTINVGSQNNPSDEFLESGDKNITFSLNLGDASELASAVLFFKAAMLSIMFGILALLIIVVITILKRK